MTMVPPAVTVMFPPTSPLTSAPPLPIWALELFCQIHAHAARCIRNDRAAAGAVIADLRCAVCRCERDIGTCGCRCAAGTADGDIAGRARTANGDAAARIAIDTGIRQRGRGSGHAVPAGNQIDVSLAGILDACVRRDAFL